MAVRRALAVAGLTVLAAGSPGAQQVRGRLLAAERDTPIRGAEVALLRADSVVASTRSDDSGYFRVAVALPGIYRLSVRRVGFAPGLTAPFGLRGEQVLEPVFTMMSVAVSLFPVVITADGLPSAEWTLGYLDRRRHGMGHHLTREDIEKRAATTTTELLRDMPGLKTVRLGMASDVMMSTRGNGNGRDRAGCAVAAFVDGLEVAPDQLNERVIPTEIEAIEVYSGNAQMPIQFQRLRGACGTIVVWTKAVVYRR